VVFVAALAVFIWLMGRLAGLASHWRWALIGVLFCAVLLVHLLLPEAAPLRVFVGGSLKGWLVAGGLVVVVLAYLAMLRLFRTKGQKRVENMTAEKTRPTFSETELNRYARHIMLREIGGAGQKKLKSAKVLVVGAGGLGSPVLLYLAAAGVGTIGVIDDDVVDNSNLQRQVIHRDADIGTPKVFSAQAAMKAQNPNVVVQPYQRRLDEAMAAELFAQYDLLLMGPIISRPAIW